MKLSHDRAVFYFGFLSIEIYWPKVLHTSSDTGIYLPTQLSIKRATKWVTWMLKWAFVLKILGFGFGLAWEHCDNPNCQPKDLIESA